MKITSLVEVISAAHLSAYVESPFPQRGGLMLVAPPGTFKTSAVKALEPFPNCKVLSDVNVQTLNAFHEDIAGNVYVTLAFTDIQKIYERHDSTAKNVEGTIKALVEEGFRHSAFNDQRMVVREARCLVVGAMTTDLYKRKFTRWREEGFLRRFIWCHFVLANPMIVVDAVDKWEALNIYGDDPVVFALPPTQRIPYCVDPKDSLAIQGMLKHHDIQPTPFMLLKKLYCVLLWRYPEEKFGRKAWNILKDFSGGLSSRGADLELDGITGSNSLVQIVREISEHDRARESNAEFNRVARKHREAKKRV